MERDVPPLADPDRPPGNRLPEMGVEAANAGAVPQAINVVAGITSLPTIPSPSLVGGGAPDPASEKFKHSLNLEPEGKTLCHGSRILLHTLSVNHDTFICYIFELFYLL